MSASKNRIDWSLLFLRIAAGGFAVLQGVDPLRHAKGAITLGNAVHLGCALGETICGALVLAGVWMIPAVITLLALIGYPLVHGWTHGASVLGQPNALFRLIATLASGLGGAGKWGIEKG